MLCPGTWPRSILQSMTRGELVGMMSGDSEAPTLRLWQGSIPGRAMQRFRSIYRRVIPFQIRDPLWRLRRRFLQVWNRALGIAPHPQLKDPSYYYKRSESVRLLEALHIESGGALGHPVRRCSYKLKGYGFAAQCGVRHPEVLGVFERAAEVNWDDLPSRFVAKSRWGYGGHRVLLLERDGGTYLDLRMGRSLTVSDVSEWLDSREGFGTDVEDRSGFWIEEMLYPPPHDWKFYTFNGTVGLVVRYDRVGMRYQSFDANLKPIAPCYRRAYARKPADLGSPVHPDELLEAACRLSRAVQHPHCRVDLYDMPDGVYLGEVTATPAAARHLIAEWDVKLGELWEQAEAELIAEGSPPYSQFKVSTDQSRI